MDVYNSMSFDIYLVNRQNMKILVPRTGLIQKGKLGFVTGVQMTTLARSEMVKVTTTDDITNSVEVGKLIDKWSRSNAMDATSLQRSNDEFLYLLDEEVLRKKHSVYIRELDVVVCMKDSLAMHPYSHQAQMLERHKEVRADLVKSGLGRRFFTWSVFVIDNSGRIGPRWINIHGSVYRVRTVSDKNCKDGFYVVRDKAVSDANEQSVPIADFIEHEEQLDFPIYKSYQEALATNESELFFKLNILKEERKIKELELETKAQRAEADRDRLIDELRLARHKSEEATAAHHREMYNLKQQIEQDRLKMHIDREKFEREKIQFEHDKVTQEQKNAGETVKVIGALVTGVIGLLVIASKWLK